MKKSFFKTVIALTVIMMFFCVSCFAAADSTSKTVVSTKAGLLKALIMNEKQIVVQGPLANELAENFKDKEKVKEEGKMQGWKEPGSDCELVSVLTILAVVGASTFIVWVALQKNYSVEVRGHGPGVDGEIVLNAPNTEQAINCEFLYGVPMLV